MVLDQRGCIYTPRVLGARVGQTLQIRNSDEVLHNLHSLSPKANAFNVSQPKAGMTYEVKLKDEDAMLRLKCDIHSWMTAFVGVVNHPYFAVSGANGEFEIRDVPAGSHAIRVWHEQYGELTQTARVASRRDRDRRLQLHRHRKAGRPSRGPAASVTARERRSGLARRGVRSFGRIAVSVRSGELRTSNVERRTANVNVERRTENVERRTSPSPCPPRPGLTPP